jgi:hypothetical protein
MSASSSTSVVPSWEGAGWTTSPAGVLLLDFVYLRDAEREPERG